MEVRIDALDGQPVLKETFVSMRVGDVQKQARFSNSRTYRFPDPGDTLAGFGRIEVFQRIGTTTVKFGKPSGQFEEVEVPCEAPEKLTQLNLKVAVKGKQGEDGSVSKKSRVKSKLDAAQKYVAHHRLEEILADAMREVMRQKPDEPISFISAHILKQAVVGPTPSPSEKSGQELPTPSKAKSVPAATETKSLEDVETARTQAREALLRATEDGSLSASFTEAREVERIHTQAREGLLHAAGNGTLSAAFGKENGTFNDVEAIRTQTTNALLRSAKDGTLSAALGEAKRSFDDVESIRAQTREALTRSAKNGTLADAFGNARNASDDVDAIRAEAREALFRSAERGKLSAVFADAIGSFTDEETLRMQARQALLRSAQDGSLKASLAEAKAAASRVSQPSGGLFQAYSPASMRPLYSLDLENLYSKFPARAKPVRECYTANFQTLQHSDLANLYSKFPARAASQPKVASSSASASNQPGARSASQLSAIPFKKYYDANFQTMPADGLAKLYSKFPKRLRPETSGIAASAKRPFALLPSVGTWLAKIPKPMLAPNASVPKQPGASSASQLSAPFKNYYDANFQSMPADGFAKLYSKFPAKPKPDTSGLVSRVHKQPGTPSALQFSAIPFREYYDANFHSMPADGFATLYSKFPTKPKPDTLGSVRATKQVGAPSASPFSAIPFKEYYDANFHSMPADGFAKLYSKFPTKPKPDTLGSVRATKQPGAPSASPFSAIPFKEYYDANFHSVPADGFAKLYFKFPTKTKPVTSGQPRNIETNECKVISSFEVMKFDDIDVNHNGKIDRDEWGKALVKANGEGGRIDRAEDDEIVVAKLQQTLSEKDEQIASLRELLKSSGHGDQLRRLEH